MELGRADISLTAFCGAIEAPGALDVPEHVSARLIRDRRIVDRAAEGDAPVYGLNTGLGANLGRRLSRDDIDAFQLQLIEGRAVATGPPLPSETGRGMILARVISAARGGSGLSPDIFDYLCRVFRAGISPVVPMHGSIGASDLTQNACWAQALLGSGMVWEGGEHMPSGAMLERHGLVPPPLLPKDGMALINHGALTVTLSGRALHAARTCCDMAHAAAALSFVGFAANRAILRKGINSLRASPGQSRTAARLLALLGPQTVPPKRPQDALSFRTVAPVLGFATHACWEAETVWTGEANGLQDSPALTDDGEMVSTANFVAPALALMQEQVAQSFAMCAHASVQRIQRLMNATLSDLPHYLSADGGVAAGLVPVQKTLAALLADVRRHAAPVTLDPAPVSDGVEDMAPMTPLAAQKLDALCESYALILGAEAMVAAQAIDMREMSDMSPAVRDLHGALRDGIAPLDGDRAVGPDIAVARDVLKSNAPKA